MSIESQIFDQRDVDSGTTPEMKKRNPLIQGVPSSVWKEEEHPVSGIKMTPFYNPHKKGGPSLTYDGCAIGEGPVFEEVPCIKTEGYLELEARDAVLENPTFGPCQSGIRLTSKDTNPKDAIGVTKAPMSTLAMPVILELGVAMLEGALKYGRHNWRIAGVRASVYFDACVARHLTAWMEGEDIDEESGMSHLVKAMAGLMILRDSQIHGMMHDDRPPSTVGFIEPLNQKVKELLAKYPNPKEPYTIKDTLPEHTQYRG